MARLIDAFTQFFDDSGNPLVNGKLRFFESGTNNTDKDTFADSALSIPNSNPVILDAAGRAPNIFGEGAYNVISYTSDDVQIQQFDPVGGVNSGGAFSDWEATTIYGEGDIVVYENKYYRSLENGNQNNNPGASPTQWEEVQLSRVFNSSVSYLKGESVISSNGTVYYSLQDNNAGNIPQSSPDFWSPDTQVFFVDGAGTVDAITAAYPISVTFADGVEVMFRASGANTISNPTFSQNGDTAREIVKLGDVALAIGDIYGAGHIVRLKADASTGKWEMLNPAIGPLSLSLDNYIHVVDEKANGVDGGGATSSTDTTRTLNTVITNTITGASLLSNEVTLPVGIYYAEGSAPALGVSGHKTRLVNNTDAIDALIGTSEFASNADAAVTRSFFSGTFTITEEKGFIVKHYTEGTKGTNGLGRSVSDGKVERYTEVKIWKIA